MLLNASRPGLGGEPFIQYVLKDSNTALIDERLPD